MPNSASVRIAAQAAANALNLLWPVENLAPAQLSDVRGDSPPLAATAVQKSVPAGNLLCHVQTSAPAELNDVLGATRPRYLEK